MTKEIKGFAWTYGDNMNTDIISPARYMEEDYETIGQHAMEGIDSKFSSKIAKGDILVAGHNFGSGSSRETAQIALKYAGVGAVIAKSFARIFYRNAINVGLPVIEIDGVDRIQEGDEIQIDLEKGFVENLTKNETYKAAKLPKNIVELIQLGGLKRYLDRKING